MLFGRRPGILPVGGRLNIQLALVVEAFLCKWWAMVQGRDSKRILFVSALHPSFQHGELTLNHGRLTAKTSLFLPAWFSVMKRYVGDRIPRLHVHRPTLDLDEPFELEFRCKIIDI